MALYIVAVLSVIFFTLYAWMKKRYSHWKTKGVKGPTPLPFIGNFGKILTSRESIFFLSRRLYNEYPNEKVIGLYQGFKPTIIIKDPEIIKQILVKDFNIFQDRGFGSSTDDFDDHLIKIEGERWRLLRQKLTPIFTSGKLKNMMPLIQNCASEFSKYVENISQQQSDHEVRDLSAKYTLSVICSCAFGIDIDCFNDKPNQFRDISNHIFAAPAAIRFTRSLNVALPGFQDLMRNLNIIDTNARLRRFFMNLTNQIRDEREGKPKMRHDFMDLMIELKEQGLKNRRDDGKQETFELTPILIAAQAFIFHAAGFETSSSTISFCIHELAVNPDIQDRVYKEICEVISKHNGEITYETLSELSYLDMCVDETLRKYPIAASLIRESSADYVLPGMNLKLDKGTSVMVPVMAIHHDPQYHPNPEVFDPERFTPENTMTRPPCTYMPFGEGPRHCIGLRFAKVQSLMGLVTILKDFKVEKSEKTEEQLTFDPRGFTLTPMNGIWVKISKR